MTKRQTRSKSAISPILATLLLIVIAVAAIVVTYAWIMTYMGSQTGQAGVFLAYDNTSWPNSTTIVLYIRNTGTSDATIDTVYVGISSTNLVKQDALAFDPSNKVVTSNGGVITITISSYTWSGATRYYFKVSPKVGVALTFDVTSP